MDAADLLNDAHLVAAFGQRGGLLSNSDLFTAIQKAEACTPLDWAKPEALGLQIALNASIKEIAPVTMLDLKTGFDPYSLASQQQNAARRKYLRFALIFTALCLLVTGAHFAVWQERASAIVLEFGKNKVARQQELIRDLIPILVQFEQTGANFEELENAGSLARETFRDRVYEARRVVEAKVSDTNLFGEIEKTFYPLSKLYYSLPHARTLQPKPAAAAIAGQPPAPATMLAEPEKMAEPEKVAEPEKMVEPEKIAEPVKMAEPEKISEPDKMPDALANLRQFQSCFLPRTPSLAEAAQTVSALKDYKSAYLFGSLVERDDSMIQRIHCLIGLQSIEQLNVRNLYVNLSLMQRRLDILNIWVLPAIYGMLGAVIFHLRICLNPMRPDPDWVRALLRVFLGGFAGVAIAWFWRPDPSRNMTIADVTIGALTVAFVVGYSLDIFFALLDRAVTVLTRAGETFGTGKLS